MVLRILFFILVSAFPSYGWDSYAHYPSMEQPFHPVSTTSKEAQEAFNQGLLGMYAFNYEGAYRKFAQASKYDPQLAMAYWGMAMALYEDYGDEASETQIETVYELGQKALKLSDRAKPSEKALIHTLILKLPKNSQANRDELKKSYSEEMANIAKAFPDDPDIATFYAESMIDLLSWDLFSLEGKAHGNALEIADYLLSILMRCPYHVGANHYYIHAIENSPHPEYGLMSAYRLDKLAPLFTDWSHLLHTPSHIYMRVGYYNRAIKDGERALAADTAYLEKYGKEGDYAIHGFTHNLTFLIMANLWSDCYEGALRAAKRMAEVVTPYIDKMPGFQYHSLYLPEVYLYFNRFAEILALPEPDVKCAIEHTYWHYARAMAYSGLKQVTEAESERKAFLKEKSALKKAYDKDTFEMAELVLDAFFAYAKGDTKQSLDFWKKAVARQNEMDYLSWYEPTHQRLGNLQLELHQNAEAEKTYREALKRFPLNGRILKGLALALKAQGKEYYWPEREAL